MCLLLRELNQPKILIVDMLPVVSWSPESEFFDLDAPEELGKQAIEIFAVSKG